jgi:hypothetical protein
MKEVRAKTVLVQIGKLIHNFIFMIGCITIWEYAFEHWPRGTYIAIGAALVCFAVWYFWMFFVRPFRTALREKS